jgi:glycerophosphoryl diester phosphodiesterase
MRFFSAGLGCALAFVALCCATSDPDRLPGVIAHRGVVLEAPENTLPAVQRAIELGCAMAEIDLRYTSDGEVILMHDATLERTTNGSGRVSDMNLARIRQLDAGTYFGRAFIGTRIPTLREAIDLARGKIQLYLDMKEDNPFPAARLVKELGAHSMVVFRPYTLLALKQILSVDPQFRVLIDMGDWVQASGMMEMLKREFPTAYFSSDWRNWNQKMVNEARKLKVATFVNVLGPDDTIENLQRAVEMGFDYIQTDYPKRLLEILNQPKSKQIPPGHKDTKKH